VNAPVGDGIKALRDKGLALQRRGNVAEARRCYLQALGRAPADGETLHLLGLCARQTGHHKTAVAFFRRALAALPDDAQLHSNLAAALRDVGRPDEALEQCRRAVALAPDLVWAHINMGVAHRDRAEIDSALAAFERALVLQPEHPDALWERSLARLLVGDMRRGFADYEARRRRPGRSPAEVPEPRWNGEEIAGRGILLHAEQGLGDTIQLVRYAGVLARRGARVSLRVPHSLARLLATVPGVTAVSTLRDPLPACDLHASLMSLPHLTATTLETIPCEIPYIAPPATAPVRLPDRPGASLKVGIAWAGNPRHRNDRARSCRLLDFLPLLERPDISVFALQTGAQREAIARHRCEGLFYDLGGRLGDFADTAAVVGQLDLVVTVDTALAHLAGAMGKPVWLLVPAVPDWRWMLERADSPWYPTMQIFRQAVPGSWRAPIAAVGERLDAIRVDPRR